MTLEEKQNTFWVNYRESVKKISVLIREERYQDAYNKNVEAIRKAAREIEKMQSDETISESKRIKRTEAIQGAIEGRIASIFLILPNVTDISKAEATQTIRTVARGHISNKMISVSKNNAKLSFLKRQNKEPYAKLKHLAAQGEGQKLEFKRSFSLKESIATTIVSFANTDGGAIYIGVCENKDLQTSDTPTPLNEEYSLIGTTNLDSNRQMLILFLGANTNIISSDLKLEVREIKSHKIFKITVPALFKKNKVLSMYKDNAYIRTDNINRKMTTREVLEYINSARPKPIFGVEDIRKIDVSESNNRLHARAFYGSGDEVPDFKGYWYGWQKIDEYKGLVWTPLAYGENDIPNPINCTEIHIFPKEYVNEDSMNATHGTWINKI